MTACAPRCASHRAVRRPRPLVPPVTTCAPPSEARCDPSTRRDAGARRGTAFETGQITSSASTGSAACSSAACTEPSIHRTGSCASARADRARPQSAACDTSPTQRLHCTPAVSRHTTGVLAHAACACTSVRATASVRNASRPTRPRCVAAADATTDHARAAICTRSSSISTDKRRRSHAASRTSSSIKTSIRSSLCALGTRLNHSIA